MNTIDPRQLEALLRQAADRLGTTPDALRQAAENGTLAQSLGDDPALLEALQSPEKARALLSSPQARALLGMLRKGN